MYSISALGLLLTAEQRMNTAKIYTVYVDVFKVVFKFLLEKVPN